MYSLAALEVQLGGEPSPAHSADSFSDKNNPTTWGLLSSSSPPLFQSERRQTKQGGYLALFAMTPPSVFPCLTADSQNLKTTVVDSM